jgi:ketosteroid isomerase-like protein
MSKESTTPDLVELTRHLFEAANRRDFDAALEFYAPKARWRGTVDDAEGIPAIRDLWVSYYGAFEELRVILDDVAHLGNGVILVASRHVGRLAGGATLAEERAFVFEFMDGRVVKASDYASLAEARAAAERLAAERA